LNKNQVQGLVLKVLFGELGFFSFASIALVIFYKKITVASFIKKYLIP
jgi:hypothetical protein